MNSADPDLQRVHELLPFHALGTLADDDRRFVDDWLARHGPAHPELLAEAAWLRHSASQAQTLTRERSQTAEAGLAELMTRIAAEHPRAARPRPAAPPPWWQRLLGSPRWATAMAALVVVQAVALVVVIQRPGAHQEALSGRSSGAATAGKVLLSVAFQPQARESDLRALLQRVQAEVVGGPSALGLWQVAVPAATAADAQAQLAAATALVESVQREP